MTANEYLQNVLASQTLAPDGPELQALRKERDAVESLLTEEFEASRPTIRYGGSKAKGTMIRESYDLDLPCYFGHEDDGAGESLEDIFGNTLKALQKKYFVQPKTSALKLLSAAADTKGLYLHIDVVPGRFTDDKKEDCYLHVANGSKSRLKTNLQKQIDHIRDSGWREAIRLAKLWRVRNGIQVKTFAIELAVIEILNEAKPGTGLNNELIAFWTTWRDQPDAVKIADPANPTGNDLSDLLNNGVRLALSTASSDTLRLIDQQGWERVFGAAEEEKSRQHRVDVTTRSAAAYGAGTKPWLDIR